jgi:hypothetical protein
MLAAGGVWLFLWSQKQGDADHAERLTLLPIENDDARPAPRSTEAPVDRVHDATNPA